MLHSFGRAGRGEQMDFTGGEGGESGIGRDRGTVLIDGNS